MTRIARGVLDSSALYAIVHGEPADPLFREGFTRSDALFIAAPTLAEISLVVLARKGEDALADLDLLLAAFAVSVVPFDSATLAWFRQGAVRYRQGTHPARLNYGDLFSYALAKRMACPLFFQGLDLSQTDVDDAMRLLGYPMSASGVPIAS